MDEGTRLNQARARFLEAYRERERAREKHLRALARCGWEPTDLNTATSKRVITAEQDFGLRASEYGEALDLYGGVE